MYIRTELWEWGSLSPLTKVYRNKLLHFDEMNNHCVVICVVEGVKINVCY